MATRQSNQRFSKTLLCGIVFILSLFNVYIVNADWNRVTLPAIPITDFRRFIGYDSSSNLIWLLGGLNNSTQLLSFNVSGNTYIDYGAILSADINNIAQSYVQNENTLYIAYGNCLYKYILSNTPSNLTIESVMNFTVNANIGCLSYVNEHLLYTARTGLHIYNIITKTWINPPNTPTMTHRVYHSCQVSNNKYLYVFGGRNTSCNPDCSHNIIHKINVSDISQINNQIWISLVDKLPIPKQATSSVIYNDMIYYIGGFRYPNSTNHDTIDVINTQNDSVYTMDASLYEGIKYVASVVVSNRIYAFGGTTYTTTTTYYQYTDIPTQNPTTATPTTAAPTSSPSVFNTNVPSFNPSTKPTKSPTNGATLSMDSGELSNMDSEYEREPGPANWVWVIIGVAGLCIIVTVIVVFWMQNCHRGHVISCMLNCIKQKQKQKETNESVEIGQVNKTKGLDNVVYVKEEKNVQWMFEGLYTTQSEVY